MATTMSAPPTSPPPTALLAAASARPGPVHPNRVVVVGANRVLADTLRSLLPACRIDQLDNYVMALGDLGVAGAPGYLVGELDPLDGHIESVAPALRRLGPWTRMVLVATQSHKADALRAVRAGFDQYVLEPVTAESLSQALNITVPAGAAAARRDSSDKPAPIQDLSASEMMAMLTGAVADADGHLEDLVADEDLGDVDLVQHLVAKRPNFAALVMRLLRARSGMGDTQLISAADDAKADAAVPPQHLHAAVNYRGRLMGTLHAPLPATPDILTAWADWLARWLAIEAQLRGLWDMALKDELTGTWNRRFFHRFLEMILHRAADERFRVTVMVFDIDDFKLFNDHYGHGAGDEILREAAKLMRSVVRTHDVVARIGGDEFAVIFWDAEEPRRPNSQHPIDVRIAADRFQKALCSHKFPKLVDPTRDTLTISGGLASFPWDGRTPEELVERADAMAMQSKRQGKNAITLGPGALRACGLAPDVS
ncbi:MAG: GGDEF domain-containing protein [Phycisphaeraceae bacterium]